MELTRDTPLSLKKYKTFGELQDAPIRSSIQCITRMKSSEEKIKLCEWLFNSHYLQKKIKGNLTDRIRIFNNKICFNYLCENYFNKFDINNHISNKILNEESSLNIKKLHSIQPSLTGTFIDYLMRRIISEIKGDQFSDNRVKSILFNDKKNDIIYSDNIWRFHVEYFTGLCQWNIQEEPNINSLIIGTIQNNHTFIELSRKDEWLNIKYEGKNGWVRYKIPEWGIGLLAKGWCVEGDIEEYIDNPWLKQIGKGHICSRRCKCVIEACNPWQETQCLLNYCQYECYHKVKNTDKFKTIEIIKDIFIVSLCHSECFGGCPDQEKVNSILNEIATEEFMIEFVIPFYNYCEDLIKDKQKIYLNPALGCKENMIPSDCDIIIDDLLIDIKCTAGENSCIEILQLLGYLILACTNPSININIDKISVINLYKGYEYIYDVSNLSKGLLLEYLKILQGKLS
jgi:uncharacterized protein YgiM (DUF1202 family)